MVIFQLNMNWLVLVALQILEAKGKTTTIRAYKCSYILCLSTGKLWPQIQWPIIKFRGLLLHRRRTTKCWHGRWLLFGSREGVHAPRLLTHRIHQNPRIVVINSRKDISSVCCSKILNKSCKDTLSTKLFCRLSFQTMK